MSMFTPRHALITGGAGFIGSHFIRLWQTMRPEIRLIILDKLTYSGSLKRLQELPAFGQMVFVQGDVCNQELVSHLLRSHQVDTIIHFAAETHVDRSISGAAPFIHTNIVGTFSLLEAARRYWLEEERWGVAECRFHQISTDEVYGSLGPTDSPFTETTSYHPNSPYSASKASADHLAWSYYYTHGLPVTFSHCSNNYGPGQQQEAFIPTVIRSCLNRQMIPIYGNGGNQRDWLYVEDHCLGVDGVIRLGLSGERYNFGGGMDASNLEIARQICAIMDRLRPFAKPHEELIGFVADRPGHDWRYAIHSGKARAELAWQPRMDFPEGLERTVAWYLENQER
ncbi:MAG: dTDP-glucose 4,6-dehydratase [Magnetococcales bacterium]|nr:dTDP-glucose 4,6-dehydratase [Magnetococcales bacterium]NGZ06250.1 dTDP-glucose 4,6-dehydratase [Magnetococcales bacterium]